MPSQALPHPTIADEIYQEHDRELRDNMLDDSMVHFDPQDKTVLLFDGPNFFGTLKALRFRAEYAKLFEFLRSRTRLQSIYYFTAVSDDPHHQPLMELILWMRNNGVRVRTRTSVKGIDMSSATAVWKGNMDVEITVVALTECIDADHVILATGDGDFVPVVRALQARGQKVTILSSRQSEPCYLSADLRGEADGFIEIGHLDGKAGNFTPIRSSNTVT